MSQTRRLRIAAGMAAITWMLGLARSADAQPLPAEATPSSPGASLAPLVAQPPSGPAPSPYAPRRAIELQYSIWPEVRSVGVGYAPLVMNDGSLSAGVEVGDGAQGPFALMTVAARANPAGGRHDRSSAVMGLAYGVAERGNPGAPRGLWVLLGGGIQPRLHSHFALRGELQVLVPARRRDDRALLRIGIGVVIGRD